MSPGHTGHLVIDTATRRSCVALQLGGHPAAVRVLEAPDRHGARLTGLLDAVLAAAAVTMDDVTAIGVGTGPGSFTGLRVGLATAKTLAELRQVPLVGIPTDVALRRAAAAALGAEPATRAAVVLPAGARDQYLSLPDVDPMLVPPDADLGALVGGRPVLAVDTPPDAPWLAPLDAWASAAGLPLPTIVGAQAVQGLPIAMLALLGERLAAGAMSDVATLVPRYVALPRGIAAATAAAADGPDASVAVEGTWSPSSP